MDDGVAIINLINRADRLATQRNVVAYSQLFTEDGQIAGDEGAAVGPVEIAHLVELTWNQEAAGTYHLTANVELVEVQSAEATALSTLLLLVDRQVISIVEVQHQLRKIAGQWYFAERKIN